MLFKALVSASVLSSHALRETLNDAVLQLAEDEQSLGQCPRTIAEVDEPLQMHFDRQRVAMGLMEQSELDDPNVDLSTGKTDKCTKRDVCLLMRQLDMDFYQRARAGTLTDMDFDTPPDLVWIKTGTCESAAKTRGKRFKPVLDAAKCRKAMRKSKLVGQNPEPATVSTQDKPAGCVIEVNNKKRNVASGFINTIENSTATAGPKRIYKGRSTIARSDLGVQVLCEHDRSLSPAAAVYYSPYKLKQSMVHRPQMSTACSFGMYAYLAKLRETKSSCAKLLTAQTSPRFYSAADALKQADLAESSGKHELASEIRSYVEDVRTKFVLIDTIANRWCPGVWNAAQEISGGTCGVPRKSNWTGEASATDAPMAKQASPSRGSRGRKKGRKGGRMATVVGGPAKAANADRIAAIHKMMDKLDDTTAELLAGGPVEKDEKLKIRMTDGKADKIALSESVCSQVDDENLADILANAPTAPPDFFQGALLDTADGEHPPLSTEESEKWVRSEKTTGRSTPSDSLESVVDQGVGPSEVVLHKTIDHIIQSEPDMAEESRVRDMINDISDVPAGMKQECAELHKTCKVIGLRKGNSDAFTLGKYSDCKQFDAHKQLAGQGAESAEAECAAILNNIASKLGLQKLREAASEKAMKTDFRYR